MSTTPPCAPPVEDSLPPGAWRLLAIVTVAQTSAAAAQLGLPALAPVFRAEFSTSPAQLSLLLAAAPLGLALSVYAWGGVADRAGELRALVAGLCIGGLSLMAGALATEWWHLMLAIVIGSLGGASAHAAGARAIVDAFPERLHGLVLGIRHTAIPVGGAIGAALLPVLAGAREGHGLGGPADGEVALPMLALGLGVLAAAASCAWWPAGLRRRVAHPVHDDEALLQLHPLRDSRLWLLAGGGALLVLVQISLGAWLALYLHDERGWTVSHAALALAAAYAIGAASRLLAGVASDRMGVRAPLLCVIAAGCTLLLVAAALPPLDAFTTALLLCVAALSASWNGVLYAATASLAARRTAGAAFGMQTTMLAIAGFLAPITFGLLVEAAGWGTAFALLIVPAGAATIAWSCVR